MIPLVFLLLSWAEALRAQSSTPAPSPGAGEMICTDSDAGAYLKPGGNPSVAHTNFRCRSRPVVTGIITGDVQGR